MALVVVCVSLAALAAFLALSAGSSGQSGPPKAAIADQLALTSPNPTFVEAATSTLEEAGYAVDYYPGEQVTVDFYRDLPRRDYDLIILRVHSALVEEDLKTLQGIASPTLRQAALALADNVFLFTSEPYNLTEYFEEQKATRVVPARYYGGSPHFSRYFAISSDFVRSSMRGDFDKATVLLMGCDGLTFDRTAAAFIQRGAGAVVGWTGPVSAPHTDTATESLLRHLVSNHEDIRQAVRHVMAEVGPDPAYGSTLLVYPPEG